MWLKHALFALALLAATLTSAELPAAAGMRYLVEFEMSCTRAELDSNTPAKLNDLLRDYKELQGLFGATELVPSKIAKDVAAVVGGGKDRFTLWVRFPDAEYPGKDEIAATLVDYAELRWRGISSRSAIQIVRNRALPETGPEQLVGRLKTVAPWLPFRELRRVNKGELTSIWWAGQPPNETYAFIDSEIAFLAQFDELGGTQLIVVDPIEFTKETKPHFATAAKKVRARPRPGKDASADSRVWFWHELQRELRSKGVKWKTPEELNPSVGW